MKAASACPEAENESAAGPDLRRAGGPGAHNLNFVNPTHYAHVVGRLLEEHPQPVPVVWNSGGYDRVDTLRALEGKIQIYLPT